MSTYLRCAACRADYDLEPLFDGCPRCGGALEVDYDYAALADQLDATPLRDARHAQGIWRFAPLLPLVDVTAAVSLGEGSTPLVKSRNVGPHHGLRELYFKNE